MFHRFGYRNSRAWIYRGRESCGNLENKVNDDATDEAEKRKVRIRSIFVCIYYYLKYLWDLYMENVYEHRNHHTNGC